MTSVTSRFWGSPAQKPWRATLPCRCNLVPVSAFECIKSNSLVRLHPRCPRFQKTSPVAPNWKLQSLVHNASIAGASCMHLLTLSRPDQVLPTIPWYHLEDATTLNSICGASTDRDSGHLATQTFTEARVSSNCAPSVFEGSNLVNNGCGRNHNGWVSVVILRRYLVDMFCSRHVF